MARIVEASPVYQVADKFRERCLVDGRSLLWPDHDAWSVANIELLVGHLREHTEGNNKDFFRKLHVQLTDSPDDVLRVAADAFALYGLFPIADHVGPAIKFARVQTIVDWRPSDLELADEDKVAIDAAFSVGVEGVNTFYLAPWSRHLEFFLAFAKGVLQGRADPYEPTSCKHLIHQIEPEIIGGVQLRHILLHLLFPDSFEAIAGDSDKRKIIDAFQDNAPGIIDPDDALLAIRRVLTDAFDRSDLTFFDPDIRVRWDAKSATTLTEGSDDIASAPGRSGAAAARRVLESAYPDAAIRLMCLRQLAESIRVAHALAQGSWGVTLRDDNQVRLNVGRLETLVLHSGALDITVDRDAADDELWTQVSKDLGLPLKWDGEPFRVIPTAYGMLLPVDRLDEALPIVRPLHLALVERAAGTVRSRTSYYVSHSPGVLEYLRAELGEDVPDPDYALPNSRMAGARRYWKIAPGGGSKLWGEFWDDGIIAVGFNATEDLRSFGTESSAEFKRMLRELPSMQREGISHSHVASQLWSFFGEMTPGDLVCAYGSSRVHGWGEITGDYRYEDGLTGYPHLRDVAWRSTEARPLETLTSELQAKLTRNTTIFELTPDEFTEIAGGDPNSSGPSVYRNGRGSVAPVVPTIENVMQATHLGRDEIEELVDLLEEKRQIVLEGPPGSGKTWVADKLARYLTGNPLDGDTDERVELVQFHQSYGYEDFVQGIRPVTDEEGALRYRVLPGIFARLCTLAKSNPTKRFVLVIDEINRGNISRIFGELLLLLEYRNQRVRLPFGSGDGTSGEAFLSIPDNLFIIGTMNSTDRSLALIDYALRRRFFFYRLMPVVDGRASVLERWLAQHLTASADRDRVLRLFVALNERIQTLLPPDYQVGHSYFMSERIGTEAGLDRIWRRAVTPLLEEYFHGARDRTKTMVGFTVDALLADDVNTSSTLDDE